jgi:hypothetical protein
MIFQSVNALEDAVMKVFLAQFVPEVFLWIQLWRVRRQEQPPHTLGRLKLKASVPAFAAGL